MSTHAAAWLTSRRTSAPYESSAIRDRDRGAGGQSHGSGTQRSEPSHLPDRRRGAARRRPRRPRPGRAQAKATITYWNGLTGADGKVMDELIDQFTKETGITIEQQRIPWAELYAKLQVSVPAGEGPDLALIHTVEVPHFASDGMLEAIDDAALGGKGFRGEDYLPATWQGGRSRASATRSRSTCRSTCST